MDEENIFFKNNFFSTDMCFLSNNIYDYFNVSQGKITIPNVDDGEELSLTDVSSIQINCYPFMYLS